MLVTVFRVTRPMPTPAPPHDVLCIGLVCTDLLLAVPHHPAPDEKLRATSRLVAPGGPAAVAAAQIARLGGRAAFAGLLGDADTDPFAALLREAFVAEGIDTSALLSVPDWETPLAAILVKPDATRAVLSHRPAPPQTVTMLVTPCISTPSTAFEISPRKTVTSMVTLPRARVLLADGHRPEWTSALLAQARATSAPLVLDAGSWHDAIRDLAPHAAHLVASEACARAALAGRDPASVPPAELRATLLAAPSATVVVTLGQRGLLWQTAAAHGAVPAFSIESMDTTGAGDAFHGAYALALARGLPLPEILRYASAAGALACTRPGAWPALARTSELEAFLARA
jgi:sulfofructose kinase